ncbi:MAG: hypothetical protein CM1200mP29_11230 [Verrucomicrobiota bacterium]|nr:MAG: hypothetical protein CM1200mP29_11230 [Verrucomicrobiota bacterium]
MTSAAKIDTCKYYFIAWVNSPVSLAASVALGPLKNQFSWPSVTFYRGFKWKSWFFYVWA